MGSLIDILCDYSVNGKRADFKFLKYVFRILREDNEEYVTKIRQKIYLSKNLKPTVHVPMAYSYFSKKIYIHPNQIEDIYKLLNSAMDKDIWDDLNRLFLFNTYVLFVLLHEFEHVYQMNKTLNPDETIESKLLGLTHFFYSEMNKEDKFSQYLFCNLGICFNDYLWNLYYDLNGLNKTFGSTILYERLADIHAGKKINDILELVDLDIAKVRNFFAANHIQSLMNGYDYKERIPFPTDRYLIAVRLLGIPEVNEYIGNVVIPSILTVNNAYDRLKYGLFVKEEELEGLKKVLV